MSGESNEHAFLVASLGDFVKEKYGANGNLALYMDDNVRGRERPPKINGRLPDLYAENVPRTFIIIGEAKTYDDLITPRSHSQIADFMSYLNLHKEGFFYLSVPFFAKPHATTIMRELGSEYKMVKTRILTPDIES